MRRQCVLLEGWHVQQARGTHAKTRSEGRYCASAVLLQQICAMSADTGRNVLLDSRARTQHLH